MAGNQEIIQNFLVSVGYTTDAISLKKFEDGLGKTGKAVFGIGTKVAGVVAAVDAAAVAFAYSMRKMYFQSELSQSTVKNLEGMQFAGSQIGVGADAMASAVHNMAQALRLNPGMQQVLESFGVRVTGRDMSDVVLDTVNALNKMPEWQAAKYGAMFGLDPDMLHQLRRHMSEVYKYRREMAGVYKEMGFDPDDPKNKKAIQELTHSLDLLGKKFEILGQKILVNFVDPIAKGTKSISDLIDLISAYTGKEDKGKQEKAKNALIGDIKNMQGPAEKVINFAAQHSLVGALISGGSNVGKSIGEYAKEPIDKFKYLYNYGMSKGYANTTSTANAPVLIQNTNINVTGTDPKSTADAVANQQSKVNASMINKATRDLKGRGG